MAGKLGRPRRVEGVCYKCGENDLSKFYRHGDGRLFSRCKKCNNKRTAEENKKNNMVSADKHKVWHEKNPDYMRNRRLSKFYDLSPEEYQSMLEGQFGLCAICGEAPKDARLVVDHCHYSGLIRGLLCGSCNLMLGNARDRINVLIKAAKYLEIHLN